MKGARPALLLLALAGCGGPSPDGRGAGTGETVFAIAGVGLDTPESALYDPVADVYLVSNIAGDPGAKDGDGFVARIAPSGELLALRWIDGAAAGVELDAPKGMAIAGAELFVADIDAVRIFDRASGAPIASVAIAGAGFLNDVAADADGNVFVSDSAADVVYRIAPDRSWTTWAAGDLLDAPNGVAVDAAGRLWIASSGSAQLVAVEAAGAVVGARDTPVGGLDGLVLLDDGGVLFSSWDAGAVYRGGPLAADGFAPLYEQLDAPADIGLDAGRGRVLIPLFDRDELVVKALP